MKHVLEEPMRWGFQLEQSEEPTEGVLCPIPKSINGVMHCNK